MHTLLYSAPPSLKQATADHASARDSWTLTGTAESVSFGVTATFFWVLVHQGFALQESIPQSCISSGGSMVELMVTSSERAYAIPRSAAPRAPAPEAVHCCPVPPQETLKPRSGSVSAGPLGPGAQGLFEPPKCLWRVWGLILNAISPLLPPCWGFSFAQRCGVSFLGGLQHSPVNSCSAQVVILEFSQEMSTPPSTPPSCQ